ncbi:MAG: ammonium transporter [Actinomycetota bacterium]
MAPIDQLWVLVATALVLVMQGGFLLLEAGMTRAKNYINVAVKNLADLGLAVVLFWFFGYGLMFGSSQAGWIGFSDFALDLALVDSDVAVLFLFQVVFAGTTVTIISGAIAERTAFPGYILVVCSMAFIYPIFGHWVWGGGWLSSLGFVDFAGSTVVHSMGGWAALAAALIIGPRAGRFGADGSSAIRPSNLPMAMTGGILLWFGWIGFNGGSTLVFDESVAGVIAITVIGGAFGLVTALMFVWWHLGYPAPAAPLNGALAGLVAVTAGAHALNTWSAAIVGAIGALVALWVEHVIEQRGIDDAVGAIPVHLGAGVWGTLATGIFGRSDALGTDLGRLSQIGVQLLGIATAAVWGFGLCWVIFKWIDSMTALRVSEQDELDGLNIAEHREPTALIELLHHLQYQTETGAIADPIESEAFTEVGQIADQFNELTTQLRAMAGVAEQIADGRLDMEIVPRSKLDTFGLAFRRMVGDLRSTVGAIATTTSGLDDSVASLRRLTDDIEDGVDVQRDGVTQGQDAFAQVSNLIDELVGEVNDLGASTTTALDQLVASMDRSHAAQSGNKGFGIEDGEDLLKAVESIASSAVEITSIVDVVRSIADTTNLLALNAHIEAHHAGGETGASFSIVAEEVRQLANGTVQSVKKIESQVAALRTSADSAVGIVHGVLSDVESLNTTFSQLSAGVGTTAEDLQSRAGAAQAAMEAISDVSTKNATTAAEVREVATSVEQGIEGVGGQLKRFLT